MPDLPSSTFSICVYCGSRPGDQPVFAETARAIGQWIGAHGGQLVYGGGRSGLMGQVADATLQAGGRVIGIIPQTLVDREQAHRGCTELHVVSTMHERKRMMAERADVFLALPGGVGTLEELFEAWTWRQLGYHNKPVGVLNVQGYYDELLAFLHTSVARGFMQSSQVQPVRVSTQWQPLLQELIHEAGFPAPTQLSAI